MKLSVTIIFLVGLINPLFAAVSSNPFLRPGSKQKIPPPPKAAKPLPVKQSDAEKQVEFRGYYILKGVPFFCVFNKKTGHAEWLGVSESSFDSYLVQQFDEKSEKLTLSFDGRSFDLFLMDSKSSGSISDAKNIESTGNSSPSREANPAKQVTRFMPPRPKTTPTLPSWLVNQRNNGGGTSNASSVSSSKSSSSYSGAVPRRTLPAPFFPGSGLDSPSLTNSSPNRSRSVSNEPTGSPSIGSVSSGPSAALSDSKPSAGAINDVNLETGGDSIGSTNSNTISLEDLPPPPPPPNILPPSPPPDIQPSRDE